MHVVCDSNPAQLRGSRERTNHDVTSPNARLHELAADRTVTSANQIAIDRVSDGLRHDDPDSQRLVRPTLEAVEHRGRRYRAVATPDDRTEVIGADHTVRPGEHRRLRGELGAPLAAAGSEDAAACAGTHPQPEAVHLGTTPIVRLESSLGHGDISKTRFAVTGKNGDRLKAVVN